jgi:fibronectin-binding autotransporter adhesin
VNQSALNTDAVASGFDASRSQLAVGWNVFVRESMRIGLGFSHGKSDLSAHEASGSVTQDIGFVYGQLAVGKWVVDGIAASGRSNWETDRPDPIAPLTTLRTDFDGEDRMFATGIRLPLKRRSLALSPYARVMWSRISREAFDEGALSEAALSSASYSASGTRITAGLLGGSADQDPLNAPFTWRFNVGAGRDDADLVQPSVEVSLTGIPTSVATPDIGNTFAFGQFTATARLTWLLYGYFGVSGEAREGKSHDVGAHLGLRMTF